jgi:hypothetical protein
MRKPHVPAGYSIKSVTLLIKSRSDTKRYFIGMGRFKLVRAGHALHFVL